MIILADVDPKIVLPVWGGASLLVIERTFSLYRSYRESRDNQTFRDHYIAQTEVLRGIHTEQQFARGQLDRIDKHVTQLKVLSGIPDSDTGIIHK